MWNGFHSYGSVEDTGRCKVFVFFFNITSTWAQMQRMKVISKALGEDCTVCFCSNETLGMILLHENACGKKTKEQARWCYFFFLFLFYHFKLCFYAFSSFKLFYKKTLDTVAILCLLFTAG